MELKPATILKVLQSNDAFRRPERFQQFLVCCEADARGRTGFEDRAYPQAELFRRALLAAQQIDLAPLREQGITGPAFGEAITRLRLDKITGLKQEFLPVE
jgi:tRNA nucleotidyltransferase (CCA-adding enzyme)